MPVNPVYGASFVEKLDVVPGMLSMLGAGLYAALAGPFRGDWGADTYTHHITHAMIRKLCGRLNTAQLQYVNPTFGAHYGKWCKANNVQPQTVDLKSGAKAFWVGDKSAKYTVVYFHGGGFSLDGDDGHISFWHTVQNELASSSKDIAFFFVEYTLVPHATYPVQFQEGVEALSYVLNEVGKSPSDVIVGGDSAGGNMALALLSHLLHPSPDAPAIKIDKPLKALVLVAPWVSFRTEWPSETRNAYKDVVTKESLVMWSSDYLAGKPATPYAAALEAPPGWWDGASEKVEGIVCVAGADEMLVDSINEWVGKYEAANPNGITYVVGKKEIHIAPILEPKLGDSKETEQGTAIKSYLKSRL